MRLSGFRRLCQWSATLLGNSHIASVKTGYICTSRLKGACVPFLNCYACPGAVFSCPIGTIQHFVAMHAFPFYTMAVIGLTGMAAGRLPCGWICPFGLLQEIMYRIKSVKYRLPAWMARGKYLSLLILVFIMPYSTGKLWFSRLCPAGTLTAAIPWALWNPVNAESGRPLLPQGPGAIFYAALLILALFLAWFVVSKRPFCRTACPLGALLSLFNGISLLRMRVAPGCDGCGSCTQNCPMDLVPHLSANDPECIRCMECTACAHIEFTTPLGTRGDYSRGIES